MDRKSKGCFKKKIPETPCTVKKDILTQLETSSILNVCSLITRVIVKMQTGIGMRVFLYSYTKPCIFASLFCHVISHCFNFLGWERERHSMSLISLITLVRNFTSLDHTVSHFISLFFSSIFFQSIRLVLRIKNQERGSIWHCLLFAGWTSMGRSEYAWPHPKWKQLIPQFSNLKFAFKMTMNSRGWRLVDIALDIKFQQKVILNGDRLWIVLNKKPRLGSFVNIAW